MKNSTGRWNHPARKTNNNKCPRNRQNATNTTSQKRSNKGVKRFWKKRRETKKALKQEIAAQGKMKAKDHHAGRKGKCDKYGYGEDRQNRGETYQWKPAGSSAKEGKTANSQEHNKRSTAAAENARDMMRTEQQLSRIQNLPTTTEASVKRGDTNQEQSRKLRTNNRES